MKKKKILKKQIRTKKKRIIHTHYSKKINRIIYVILIAFTFLLYANTINHDFVLDDGLVIRDNEFTKNGIAGIPDILSSEMLVGVFGKDVKNIVAGGRYRPLSLVTFAIEYQFAGLNPHVHHFFNIVFYALTSIILYIVLSKLLIKFKTRRWYFSIPFLATVLFVAHPIHTEVVTNIKGRDEIMTLLGSLLTLWFILRYLDTKKLKFIIISFFSFFLALLSKENAITFIAIIPVSIYFFTTHRLKKNKVIFIPLLLASFLFLIIRNSIIGNPTAGTFPELLNNPFIGTTFLEKYATIFYTLGLYIKLLIFPHPLTYDYYPYHIAILKWADWRPVISLLVYLALGTYAVIGFKKKKVISYSIWFYLLSLSIVSNVFFPIGTFMSERFVFISSIGLLLIVAYVGVNKIPHLLVHKIKLNKNLITNMMMIIFGAVLIMYSVKTMGRNRVWVDEFTLFTTDIEISKNSAMGNNAAGKHYIFLARLTKDSTERARLYEKGLLHIEKAIDIHPQYKDALSWAGDVCNEYSNNVDKAIFYYKRALELDPNRFNLNYLIGDLYGLGKNYREAEIYLQKAVQLRPQNFDALKKLGIVYYNLKKHELAIEMFEKATHLNPGDASVLKNLGIAYNALGDVEKSEYYYEKEKRIRD